ncbi:MAG TPA: hypothetical protein VNN81_03340 [Bradyrhizobium sp.]|jgi:hypothetical protein|nr:hypothetical protein [Bradyrhizobium sp.]
MVFTVCVGPRHPRNFSFLFSSASVAWKGAAPMITAIVLYDQPPSRSPGDCTAGVIAAGFVAGLWMQAHFREQQSLPDTI